MHKGLYFIKSFVFLCFFFCLVARVQAESSYKIYSVVFDGNRNVESAALQQQLKHASGDVSSQMISDDVKNLYRTEFFDQVSASVSTDAQGRQILKYSLVEKPLVRKVFIKGNKEIDEDSLAKILVLGPKRFLDKGKIEALIRSAVSYYQNEGFYDASFEYSVVPIDEGQVDVTFTVKEGDKIKIREIKIEGLDKVDEGDLISSMQTRRYKWWSSWIFGTGRLNREALDGDKTAMRQFFLDRGYVDGSVSEPSIERKPDGIYITFRATEGAEYKIGEVTASGDLIDDKVEETLKDTKIKSGDVFSASLVREDVFKISDKFSDRGFAFANVIPDTGVNRDQALVDVNFKVNKGKLIKVRRIKISGNNKTYDNVIRREMQLDEQDTYSSSKVKRSQQMLQRLGYFEEVNISNQPTDKDDEIDLGVNVREGSTGTFSAGVGYSSADGALFNSRISEANLFGTGRSASLNVDLGTERSNIILSLDDRRFNDTNWALGTDLFIAEREFTDFDRKLTGGSISAGYPLDQFFGEWARDTSFGLKYELMQVEISNIDTEDAADLVIASEGTSTSSAITPRLVRNTLNNRMDPTEGMLHELSFETAGLGGDEEYYLAEFKHTLYQPLFDFGKGQAVFSWRTNIGYGESLNDDPFPLFKRYFPGGINTIRGYKNRTLGPKDSRGNEYGGSKQLINNFEFIFPLVSSAGLKTVVFYDWGEAFDDNKAIQIGDLREAYGFGLRWSSPLGPIRVEFGFPVDRLEGEKSMVTMFTFGAPF